MTTCAKCGKATEHEVEVSGMGTTWFTDSVCEDCWDMSMSEFRRWRLEFQRLLRSGMTPKDANERMCQMIRDGVELPPLVN